MEPSFAFIASGSLFVKRPGEEPREVESRFAKESMERQAKLQAVDGWRSRSGVWGSMGMAPPEFSQWEQAQEDESRARPSVRCATRGSTAGSLCYLLQMGDVVGLLQQDLDSGQELRLMHRNGFPAEWLACHPDGTIATSVRQEDGTVLLAISETEGRHWNNVVGGDAVDQAPTWAGGNPRRLVYQSAPVARDEAGLYRGLKPYVVESLTLQSGAAPEVLLQRDGQDLLLPRATEDGRLYCIRRPYKPLGQGEFKPHRLLLDIILFPFRLLRAIFHFLNFFSLMFSGKPLATENGPRRNPKQQPFLMLWGHMIDTRQAMAKRDGQAVGSLVPKDWELVRNGKDGEFEILAKNVLAYDLCQDGSVVYTDGMAVFYRSQDGEITRLCEQPMVESVVALD